MNIKRLVSESEMGVRGETEANGEAIELEDIDVTDGAPAGSYYYGNTCNGMGLFSLDKQ